MTKTQARKERDRQQREQARRQREYEARVAQITTDFEGVYGRDDTKLDKWQRLCHDVGVPEAASITQCKKALKGIYINIVDFVAAKRDDRPVRVFQSYKALQHYIQNDRSKIYPKHAAKDSPILKWMLISVF